MVDTKVNHQSSHASKAASRRVLEHGVSPDNQDLNEYKGNNNSSHSPRSQVSAKKQKEIKPAISENWKNLFKKDPIFMDPFEKSRNCKASGD